MYSMRPRFRFSEARDGIYWKGPFFLSYKFIYRNSFLTNTETHRPQYNNKIDRENIIVEFSVCFFDGGRFFKIFFLLQRDVAHYTKKKTNSLRKKRVL